MYFNFVFPCLSCCLLRCYKFDTYYIALPIAKMSTRLPVLLLVSSSFKGKWRNMSHVKQSCHLSKISVMDQTPVQMLQSIIGKIIPTTPLVMNLATADKEFGALNRSVIYRGLSDDNPPHICFVTERNSRKYQNLKENPKMSVTMLFSIPEEIWQIRLFNAEAHELNDQMITKFWQKELLASKIRSHICECGKPNNGQELERKCQEIIEKYERECKEPEQTKSYTAFKIVPKLWDFYMSEPQKIADRVQYKLIEGETDKWEIYHVNA